MNREFWIQYALTFLFMVVLVLNMAVMQVAYRGHRIGFYFAVWMTDFFLIGFFAFSFAYMTAHIARWYRDKNNLR